MNDMFDELKAIKTELKKQEPKPAKKATKNLSQKAMVDKKEDELRADFLEYMKDTEVKKI